MEIESMIRQPDPADDQMWMDQRDGENERKTNKHHPINKHFIVH